MLYVKTVASLGATLALLAAVPAGEAADAGGGGGDRASQVALTPDALAWEAVPVVPGMMQARVWGAADGPQGRFVKMPANARLPLHKHTANVRVVVVSGTYVYGVGSAPEGRYASGSFIVTPAGLPHVAGCGDACVYYEDVDAKPDYTPVATTR